MNTRKPLQWMVILALSTLILACSLFSVPPTAAANPSGSVSSDGLNTPVSGGKWEVTITDAHEEKQLMGSNGTQYTPNSGYTFLVVDATFRNLDSSQETKISADSIAVIDSAGDIFTNIGSGFGITYSIGGTITYYNEQNNTLKLGLVFSVKKENIDKVFTFQFMDVPKIPLTVKPK